MMTAVEPHNAGPDAGPVVGDPESGVLAQSSFSDDPATARFLAARSIGSGGEESIEGSAYPPGWTEVGGQDALSRQLARLSGDDLLALINAALRQREAGR